MPWSREKKEFYVKITPRAKGNYGFCTLGSDYDNFKNVDECDEFYKQRCQEIIDNIEDHYRDGNIGRIEICDDEYERTLEEKCRELKYIYERYMNQLKSLNPAMAKDMEDDLKEVCNAR